MDEGSPQEEVNPRGPVEEEVLGGREKATNLSFSKSEPSPLIFWVPFVYKSDALLDFLLVPHSWCQSPTGAAGVTRASWTLLCGLGKSTVLPSDLQTLNEG